MNPLDDPIMNDRWPELADYAVIDQEPIDPEKVARAKVVYMATHRLREFFPILGETWNKVTLLSSQLHGVDCSDYNTHEAYSKIASWGNIKHWWVRNLILKDNRVSPLPIGIQVTPQKLSIMKNVSEAQLNYHQNLYVNCEINTNHGERSAAYKCAEMIRSPSHDIFIYPGIAGTHAVGFREYVADLKESRFVLCPPGSGLDTWRMFETLYMGSIPVVRRSPMTEYYSNLWPMVLIDFYEELPELFAGGNLPWDKVSCTNPPEEFLTFSWWRNKILCS